MVRKNPAINLGMQMGENDDTIFEDSLEKLREADLSKAKNVEMVFVLGMAAGTIARLRTRIKELEQGLNGQQ